MKRKILTLLLALAMVLTMLPMTALAADGNVAEVNGQGYSTLQSAINAVQTAGTVKLLENVKKGEVFVKVGEKRWECRNCGHIYIGEKAPEVCPVCKHPKAFFEIEAQNY